MMLMIRSSLPTLRGRALKKLLFQPLVLLVSGALTSIYTFEHIHPPAKSPLTE